MKQFKTELNFNLKKNIRQRNSLIPPPSFIYQSWVWRGLYFGRFKV